MVTPPRYRRIKRNRGLAEFDLYELRLQDHPSITFDETYTRPPTGDAHKAVLPGLHSQNLARLRQPSASFTPSPPRVFQIDVGEKTEDRPQQSTEYESQHEFDHYSVRPGGLGAKSPACPIMSCRVSSSVRLHSRLRERWPSETSVAHAYGMLKGSCRWLPASARGSRPRSGCGAGADRFTAIGQLTQAGAGIPHGRLGHDFDHQVTGSVVGWRIVPSHFHSSSAGSTSSRRPGKVAVRQVKAIRSSSRASGAPMHT